MLENDFVDCIKEAGSKNSITQVHRAVALKQKSEWRNSEGNGKIKWKHWVIEKKEHKKLT